MTQQRQGYPNLSVKLYESYDAWLENRFLEMAGAMISMTIRDGLMNGINEGLLQIMDTKSLQTMLSGNELIQISVKTANTDYTYNRIYGVKHLSASVNSKGDNIITFQLGSVHSVANLKFSRALGNNAQDSITEMINYIYRGREKIIPKFDAENTRVPGTNWVLDICKYFEFVRKYGQSVTLGEIPLLWEDMNGMHLSDFGKLNEQEPVQYVVSEPKLLGELVTTSPVRTCFDFEWLTKANGYRRNPMRNMSFYAHSFIDKQMTRVVTGEGENATMISRSGAYYDQVHRNGLEEYEKSLTFSEYDAYATAKTYGEFGLTPGTKLAFYDSKNQFRGEYFVDEVIHEISREQSLTNIYMFNNALALKPFDERQTS
ncbi:baseplate hub [Aeromonas phage GomatiRiver_11]|nr:baseplate central spike complex protein [Aeromonas phage AhFM11]WKW84429.1 baseplate hub [Aeromonas phage GomatiRiver_11]